MSIQLEMHYMTLDNLPEVLKVEEDCYEFPWTRNDFLCCLGQRTSHGIVAEYTRHVVGFMMYEFLPHLHLLHVLNFAVSPSFRRKGVGTEMVWRLKQKLSEHSHHAIILEVRETNLPAQLFLRSRHFEARTVLRGYYQDTIEDAYQMSYELPGYQEMLVAHQPKNRVTDFWDILQRQKGSA